jgi:hypothetical protein
MRRSLVALTALSALWLTACEDGPTQTYTPSPDGANNNWNDGNTPGTSDPATQGYGQQNGGTNKQEICTGPQLAVKWASMFKAPIKPPRFVANLDLAGGDNWKGLTIDQAEQINCQSTNYGDLFGDGAQDNYWGDNGEVFAEYIVSSRRIDQITLSPGYLGTLDMTSRDGAHTYSIPIQLQMSKDGAGFKLDWLDPVLFPQEVNELYDAALATYAPGLPPDPDCFGSGACITGNFGDVAYIYWPALGTGIWVDNQNAPQPTPSIITRIDLSPAKTLPFSLANPLLKLDAVGPVGLTGKLGKNTQDCQVQMGLTFKQFLADCVEVTGTTADTTEHNKLVGGLTHSSERFFFDVQGVDLNFSDRALPIDDIIHDSDLPHDNDVATELTTDQATLGKIANDYPNNDPTANPVKDLHGAGLVNLEYARLVQDGLNKYIPLGNQHQLGDPACLTGFGASTDVDPDLLDFAPGCTGFEGFITAAPPQTGDPQLDHLALGPAILDVNHKHVLGLKPGHPQATFCLDANGQADGYTYCHAPAGRRGDLFATSFARVLQVLGKNKVPNLPIEAQDIRFFWKQYVIALIKYFKVAGTANENIDGVHAQFVDPDNLFFDSAGSGQFETGEYVDRRFVTASQDPIDVTFTADIKNGIFNDYSFSRDTYRGETAIYSSVVENPVDPVGKEDTGLLTNIFGSPILATGWSDVLDDAGNVAFSAYYCATHMDPGNCQGQYPPLDAQGKLEIGDNGLPRLARYKGAIGGARTPFALGPTPIKITQLYPNIQQAMISLPLHTNPYDPTSPAAAPLQTLIPWTPKQPGIGFPIALTGTLDKFIETAQLDFSGNTITANVDYDAVIDPVTMAPKEDGSLQFLAVETSDFLGEVFLCQDPATGDLLGARMYSPVAGILDWFSQHPGTYQACGIIIRYSPYGNYADYITSTTNGVRLNITQGGGFGRVVDVTLFVPGQ